MKKLLFLIFLVSITCTVVSFISKESADNNIAFPEGYRDWVHIKSSIVGPSSPAAPKYEGFTHIYANAKALEGYKSGDFPDGSVIVFDVLASEIHSEGVREGDRKFIDVMVKNSSEYKSTGGWGYEEFEKSAKSNGILTIADKKACFNCHQSRKKNDFVFSKKRD